MRSTQRILMMCSLLMLGIGLAPRVMAQDVPAGLDAWEFYDPHDSSLPDTIVADGDTFQLDADWEVSSIGYLYQWWGLGDPVFGYQTIERDGDTFHKGDTAVDPAAVEAFLDSIDELYSTQFLLAGQDHTDDYPSWKVELQGTDGQSVILFSSSTGNPGFAPWNVLANGRMYVQYDGSLAEPLSALFTSASGEPAAAFFPGGRNPDTIAFSTSGWPGQLAAGFTGLLPISDTFQYRANAREGILEGYLEGRSSIGGFGNMVIGTITNLKRVSVTVADELIDCDIEAQEASDPAYAGWLFSCDLGEVARDTAYRYPISVEFSTSEGEAVITEGILTGLWDSEADFLLVPPDAQVQASFMENEVASDLFSDHVFAYAFYQAELKSTDLSQGVIAGEAVLLGQTDVGGQPVRYSIATPFAIEDGTLTRWDLSRDALDTLLGDIVDLPLVARAQEADDNLLLNLWYSEANANPEMSSLINAMSVDYWMRLEECQSAAHTVPSEDEPLRAFSMNSLMTFRQPDFVLVDGQPVVANLDLFPTRGNRGDVLSVLLPDAFDTGDLPSFERVWMSNTPYYGSSELTLWIPENADKADLEAYEAIAGALGGTLNTEYDTLWTVSGITFNVTDDGELTVVPCET